MAIHFHSLTEESYGNRNTTHGQRIDLPAIILAAGQSQRMAQSIAQSSCKLLLPLRGQPLIAHAVQNALDCGVFDPILVVVGPNTPQQVSEIISTLEPATLFPRPNVGIVTAFDAAQGQAQSLKAGLGAALTLFPHAPGIAVLLGDQPFISPVLLQTLHMEFFTANANTPTCVAPSFEGQRGNPVFLPRELFSAMSTLSGDQGARSLLATLPLRLVSCLDNGCLQDVDTPEQYARLLQ